MKPRRAIALVVVVLGVLALASFGGVTGAIADDDSDSEEDTDETTDLGVQMGAFMQTSSADAESAVSDRLFEAEYERTTDRAAAIDRRANGLEARIAELEQQKAALEDREGDPSTEIRMSRIASRIHALNGEVDRSAEVANAGGHDGAAFDDLSERVTDLRGPDVATAAGAIPGGPAPEEVGPPDDVPGQSDDDETDRKQSGADGERHNGPSEPSGQSDTEHGDAPGLWVR